MIPPTPTQATVLAAIRKLSKRGIGVSYDDILQECGLKSRGNLSNMLADMKDRGLVDYEPYRARTIRAVQLMPEVDVLPTADLLALRARVDAVLAARAA